MYLSFHCIIKLNNMSWNIFAKSYLHKRNPEFLYILISVSEMLYELGWSPLSQTRREARLILSTN